MHASGPTSGTACGLPLQVVLCLLLWWSMACLAGSQPRCQAALNTVVHHPALREPVSQRQYFMLSSSSHNSVISTQHRRSRRLTSRPVLSGSVITASGCFTLEAVKQDAQAPIQPTRILRGACTGLTVKTLASTGWSTQVGTWTVSCLCLHPVQKVDVHWLRMLQSFFGGTCSNRHPM